MQRRNAAMIGAALGAAAGVALLVLTHPTSAYTNDAYRHGQAVGYIVRYAVLGSAAALLLRMLLADSRVWLAAMGLVIVAAAAILPPGLRSTTSDEQRRAAAVAIDNPKERRVAEMRAGAIQGCTEVNLKQLEGTRGAKDLHVDDYCTCFIDSVLSAPQDDEAQMLAMVKMARTGQRTELMRSSVDKCSKSSV